MNRWILTDEIRNKFKPLLTEYFTKVENVTFGQVEKMTNEELGLDLSDKGINPYQLWQILEEEFNYRKEDIDWNGWEQDFWIKMKRTDGKYYDSGCENLIINCCGMTFELKIYIEDFDF